MIAVKPPRRPWNAAERTLAAFMVLLGFFTLEIKSGSGPAFAGLVVVYVMAVGVAIWAQGGIQTIFGVFILYFASQHVLVSQVVKGLLGENPETKLLVPLPTIITEILVMVGFAITGWLASKIRPNRGLSLFPPVVRLENLRRLAVACTLLALPRIAASAGNGPGPIKMLVIIDILAIVSAVGVAVTESGGKRLTNGLVWSVVAPLVLLNLISGARGAASTSVLAIGLAGWAFGYRYRFSHLVGVTLLGAFIFFIVSPFSLRTRLASRTGDTLADANASFNTFVEVASDPLSFQFYNPKQIEGIGDDYFRGYYYDITPGPLQDVLMRFSLIKLNDIIVDDTLKTGTTGWTNLSGGLENLAPSFARPEETGVLGNGNALAHRTWGIIPDYDHATGITLGITPDAFSAFSYPGTLLLPILAMLPCVVIYKLITPLSLHRNVFALAIAAQFANFFSEAMFSGFLQLTWWYMPIFAFGLFLATRAAMILDTRYLRPRAVPESLPNDGAGASPLPQ